MFLKDVIGSNSRIFLKSEWSPISDHWPSLSFSRQAVLDLLKATFNPQIDVVIYVGTGNPKSTGNPAHQRRLLSVIQLESLTPHPTNKLIPRQSWADAQKEYGARWKWSLIPRSAWDIVNLPLAKEVIPDSYRLLGKPENRGNIVEILPSDRSAIMSLEIIPVPLRKQPALQGNDEELTREIDRMCALLLDREKRAGTESTRINPERTVEPGMRDTLRRKWEEQSGTCALCGGALVKGAANRLLQASPDRINSQIPEYSNENTHITHLGCNLAKNDVSMAEFAEWLAVVRKGLAAKATAS